MGGIESDKIFSFIPEVKSELSPLWDDNLKGILLGIKKKDHQRYGSKGLMQIGRLTEKDGHDYFGSNVYLNAMYPHVIFICGQRGTGKSYTLGVIIEELAKSNIGIGTLVIDPVGVFWTMKKGNKSEEELIALKKWGLSPLNLDNVRVLFPINFYDYFKDRADGYFTIRTSDVTVGDWGAIFEIKDEYNQMLDLIESAMRGVRNGYLANVDGEEVEVPKAEAYSIGDLIQSIDYSIEIKEKKEIHPHTKNGAKRRLNSAAKWGLFSREGTPIQEIVVKNEVTVIDVSPIDRPFKRSIVAGILARKIFNLRKLSDEKKGEFLPVTWLIIDEAHTMLPRKKETVASESLITYAKEGRSPGCGLVLATQEPASVTDSVLKQSTIMMTHSLSNVDDIRAFQRRAPAKIPKEFDEDFIRMIKTGACIIADRETQKRAMVVQIRPRKTHHGGKEKVPTGKEILKVHVVEDIEGLSIEKYDDIKEKQVEIKIDDWLKSVDRARYNIVIVEKDEKNPFHINSDMVRTAKQLVGDHDTLRAKAKAIFDWMQQNITYDFEQSKKIEKKIAHDYKDSETALIGKRGVCGEQAYLYVAMARSVGLDSNYVLVDIDNSGKEVTHACANVMIEEGPVLVDPAYNMFDIHHKKYEVLLDQEAIKNFKAINP